MFSAIVFADRSSMGGAVEGAMDHARVWCERYEVGEKVF